MAVDSSLAVCFDRATGLPGEVYAVPVTTSSSLAGLDGLTFLTGLGALAAGLGGLLTGLGGSAVESRCSTVGLGGA